MSFWKSWTVAVVIWIQITPEGTIQLLTLRLFVQETGSLEPDPNKLKWTRLDVCFVILNETHFGKKNHFEVVQVVWNVSSSCIDGRGENVNDVQVDAPRQRRAGDVCVLCLSDAPLWLSRRAALHPHSPPCRLRAAQSRSVCRDAASFERTVESKPGPTAHPTLQKKKLIFFFFQGPRHFVFYNNFTGEQDRQGQMSHWEASLYSPTSKKETWVSHQQGILQQSSNELLHKSCTDL